MTRLVALVAGTLCLLAVAMAPDARAARREHTVHGTVRKLCDPVDVRKWPGGPSAGRVAAGKDLRRYQSDGPWALGVTTRRPFVRGYVLVDAFCPPSPAGRRARAAARRLAAHPPRGRPGTTLAAPVPRRVCAPVVYLRDRPLNRAIALLYVGDTFLATRLARNPWLGGLAHGHARRRGWVPRSALCRGLDRRAPGSTSATGPAGSAVLAPPAVVRCGARVSGRRMLGLGVRGSADVSAQLRDPRGTVVSSARFVHGRRARWSYGAAGPYRCGASYAVVYESHGATVRFGVTIARAGRPGLAATASFAARSLREGPLRRPAACTSVDVADLRNGAIRRVAEAAYRPSLGADGRFVAYESRVDRARDTNRDWDVYRVSLATGERVLLSAASDGRSRRGQSLAAVLSADGSVAAFESDAPLSRGDRSGLRDIFVRDVRRRRTTLVSANRCGRPADGYSRCPSIAADGRLVAFDSHATDLVHGAPRGRGQVYLRDRSTMRLLSVTPTGRASARTSFSPALAARAALVAFPTFAYDLGPRDANARVDIYLRDVARASTHRLSRP